jgi:hypothetical protein
LCRVVDQDLTPGHITSLHPPETCRAYRSPTPTHTRLPPRSIVRQHGEQLEQLEARTLPVRTRRCGRQQSRVFGSEKYTVGSHSRSRTGSGSATNDCAERYRTLPYVGVVSEGLIPEGAGLRRRGGDRVPATLAGEIV